MDKKALIRPVIFGISISHINVTAGTNGWLFEKDGIRYFGSSAHVFVPDPRVDPEEVSPRDIIQPGSYDGGTIHDKVANYVWHKKIYPSKGTCKLARFIVWLLNSISKLFGRKTRFEAYEEQVNHIDFAVAIPTVDYQLKLFDFDNTNYKFVGLLFAGSSTTGVICKAKYILKEGYKPVGREIAEVKVGDIVEKSSRTSCHSSLKVIDDSARVQVSYGTFVATFDDVILTDNPDGKAVQGGDSGSSVWVKK